MASVIVEGGNNPIEVRAWRDSLKVGLMYEMYHQGRLGAHKDDLFSCDLLGRSSYGHAISTEDIAEALREMFREGWIEISATACECCLSQKFDHNNFLKHAVRLRLTQSGYHKVPEHIFP